MKKILLLATALLPGALLAQNLTTELYVTTGGYHNRDCRGGAGICRDNTVTPSLNKTNAIIRKSGEFSVELSIHESDFTEDEIKTMLQDMIFNIDEATTINELILSELNISSKYTVIKPGNYPIVKRIDRFDIILVLTDK